MQSAISAGDKEGAEEILRNSEQITGGKRIAAYSAIKRAFPEERPQFKSVWQQREEQAETDNHGVGDALARRRASREKQKAKFPEKRPQRGWAAPLGPPEEDHLYIKPNPSGRNLP